MRTGAKFRCEGERAAFEAGEEAPLCPVCDCPMVEKYDWERIRVFCPECEGDNPFPAPPAGPALIITNYELPITNGGTQDSVDYGRWTRGTQAEGW
jgi:hypothetical protein